MLEPNTLLQNRYLIERKLGQGGMGAVYQAVDKRFDTTVALKQTLVRDENLRKAFEREARLLNKLRHAALPHVIDFFAEGENEFLVMQFIPGDDFAALLEKNGRPFEVDQVLSWADQILAALEYLHSHEPPIVHRDIKPQNLKRTPQGEIVLLDFGLSKGSAADLSRVAGGASVAGYTPHFAPLEQIRGAGTNPRSDLYSLAATLYMLLTGQMPPDALERASAMLGGRPDPLRPVAEVNPRVPAAVSSALQTALAQAPESRWSSASAMRKALREAGQGDAARTVQLNAVHTAPAGDASTRPGGTPPGGSYPPPAAPYPSPGASPPIGAALRPQGPPPGGTRAPSGPPAGLMSPPGVPTPAPYQSPGAPPGWAGPQAAAPAPYPPFPNVPSGPRPMPPSHPISVPSVPSVPEPPRRLGVRATLLALWLTLGLGVSFVIGFVIEVIVVLAMGEEYATGRLTFLLFLVVYVIGAIVFGFLVRR